MIGLLDIQNRPGAIQTTSQLTARDKWDHILARIGYKRGQHRVQPGLYSLGHPDRNSPVFVTANYTLSFDALRSNLDDQDAYLLVLDTQGINVWCAAGKKTFGTDEVVLRLAATQLNQLVDRKVLILPQLGAAGVSAHEVKKRSGFKVEYGPVRAADLGEFLKCGQVTTEMRKVRYNLLDRLVLIPVDITQLLPPFLLAGLVAYFLLGGWFPVGAILTILLSSVVLFPMLLPVLPTANFSSKGFILGYLTALPFFLAALIRHPDWSWYRSLGQATGYLLSMPAVIAFIALNFTGSSTFTSKTGVRREMYAFIPAMAWTFGIGVLVLIAFIFIH